MKKALLMFAVSLSSTFAQATTATDVCVYLAGQNAYYGTQCQAAKNRGPVSSEAAELCMVLAEANANAGVECIAEAANKTLDRNIVPVCSALARSNVYYGSQCLKGAFNKYYSTDDLRMCDVLSKQNANSGVECVTNSGSATPPAPLRPACITRDEVTITVIEARRLLRNGLELRADAKLEALQFSLENCR